MQVFFIDPHTKPRMTQSDKWKKRKCVLDYFAFKDEVQAKRIKVPECGYHVYFLIPMPESWSKKKKQRMFGKPHQQTPDKDNLEKGLLDAIYEDDKHIWDGRVSKFWSDYGMIIIEEIPPAEFPIDIIEKYK